VTIESIVPVPLCVQHRARDCARDLLDQDMVELSGPVHVLCEMVVLGPVDAVTWAQSRFLLRAHRLIWPVRA
jgi:hypothetical protein